MKLYTPRIPIKDELKLRTGIDCKKVVRSLGEEANYVPKINEFKYICQENHFIFKSRTEIKELTSTKIQALQDGLDKLTHSTYWTGSSFDGFLIKNCDRSYYHENVQGKKLPYVSILHFNQPLKAGEQVEFVLETTAKDARCIMSPYYAQLIMNRTEKLKIVVSAPQGLLEDVEQVIYADAKMSKDLEISREAIKPKSDKSDEHFTFEISNPNIMYSYSIEWKFNQQF